jgi:hypothetical protein
MNRATGKFGQDEASLHDWWGAPRFAQETVRGCRASPLLGVYPPRLRKIGVDLRHRNASDVRVTLANIAFF